MDRQTERMERAFDQSFEGDTNSIGQMIGVDLARSSDETHGPAASRRLERLSLAGINPSEIGEGQPLVMRSSGTEAIINIYGRPALRIDNGSFARPPANWGHLDSKRDQLQTLLPSIGRICVAGAPEIPYAGTGFVVGEDLVMTNRHVAEVFAMSSTKDWVLKSSVKAGMDYDERLRAEDHWNQRILRVEAVHPDRTVDLALLRVEAINKFTPPDPLPLGAAGGPWKVGNDVVVVGYPERDAKRNVAAEMDRIFENIYGTKRLQPGKIVEIDTKAKTFSHDSSTLGGNSGSCVIDLDTLTVIGLHVDGAYLTVNHAVALWTLEGDAMLRQYIHARFEGG
jgi:glutamyl endopeptidase